MIYPPLTTDDDPRVVLDTNVVVALLVFADPRLVRLGESWNAGSIIAIADDETLAELSRVLRYPELRVDESRALDIDLHYRERCTIIAPDSSGVSRLPRCRDADDQKFLQLAHRGEAACLLTRDKELLRLKRAVSFRIISPESAI